MDYTVLKTEINTDPEGIGLTWAKTDQENADLLNTPGLSGETTTRETANTADIITAMYSNKDEFMALSQLNIVRLNLLSPVGDINPAAIQDVIKEIFTIGVSPNIRAALTALATRDATRAEKVVGLLEAGESVSKLDVHIARRQ
jgi:hypothetical protein